MLQLDRHVPSPGVPEFNRRFGWLVAFIAIAFLVLIGRLWQLQVVRGEKYFQQSANNFKAEQWIAAVRGRVLDRKGNVLVDNRPAFNVWVRPRYFTKDSREHLARLLGVRAEDLAAKVAKLRQKGLDVLLLEDVTRDQLALITQAESNLPGVYVRDAQHRNYLHGTLAAHVVGYMNQISETEIAERREDGYEDGDYIGRYGIEKQWEGYLRGKRGVERFVVDAKGNRQDDRETALLIDQPRFVPPVPGHNVVLTLDLELQRIAERAMRNQLAGGIAVVEVLTGRILALVSKPPFDPNTMTGRLTPGEYAQLEADPHKPFLDKTLRQHYPPGSTYKFVTALAALEQGIDPSQEVKCHGAYEAGRRAFHCMKAHGPVDMHQALTQSCDVYFWHVAEKIGLDRISQMAQTFGFGAPTGLGLNGDVAGHLPWKAWYESHGGYRIGYALNTAIGQGDTNVTVLQLALAYAALSNGGNLWVPQIVRQVETAGGTIVKEYPPTLRHHLQVANRAMTLVRKGLHGVVNEKKGTAFGARIATLNVAGKTGTAQVTSKLVRYQKAVGYDPERDHAWFAGYAPAEDTQVAIVVLIEHGGHGGQVAAPIAMEILKGYFEVVAK